MDWSDQPAGSPASYSPSPGWAAASAPAPAASTPPTGSSAAGSTTQIPVLGGAKRLIATALLAVGLLGVGGAAVVFAADPSATPAPSAGTTTPGGSGSGVPTTPGGRTGGPAHAKGDCPNMGGSGGSGGSGTAPNGSAPGSSTAPST